MTDRTQKKENKQVFFRYMKRDKRKSVGVLLSLAHGLQTKKKKKKKKDGYTFSQLFHPKNKDFLRFFFIGFYLLR